VEERDRRVLSESLRDVSRALVGTLSEQSAMSTVLDQMWRVVRYQAAVAVVLEGRVLRVAASRGGDPEGEMSLDQAGTCARRCSPQDGRPHRRRHPPARLGLRG
jgi:hypothetical protein